MKILSIVPSLRRGGGERVASLLTQAWAIENDVLLGLFDTSDMAYKHGGELRNIGAEAAVGSVQKGANLIRRAHALSKLIRRERPDRIISFMESANFPTIAAAAQCRALNRLTVSVHNDPHRFPAVYRSLIPLLYRLPARVVAVSHGVKDALVDMGVPKAKVWSIPNPGPPPSMNVSLQMPEGVSGRYVLGVGRLHPQKGFERFIEAFASIRDLNLELIILGEGQERRALELKARALGVANRVKFPGAVADPLPWYRHASCFVLSSRYEGWGNVIVEAMSAGCPVVSFDCRFGPSEIIEDGVNGVLVREGDVEGLGRAVQRVINDDGLRAKLVSAGIERAEGFTVDKLAPRWLVE